MAPKFTNEVFKNSTNPYNIRKKYSFEPENVKSVYNGTETIFRGPQIWALVPENIKQCETLDKFKAKIMKWKPIGCKCRLCKTYIPHLGFIND